MNLFEPIFWENDEVAIHPLRPHDMERYSDLVKDIFAVLSDEYTLKYIPEKRVRNIEEAEAFLRTMILNDYSDRNFFHYISDRKSGRVIGMVDIITPGVAKEYYTIDQYPYFIEFYLAKSASGNSVMSQALPYIVNSMQKSGIQEIAAVIDRKNIAAKRVLEKANFKCAFRFDFQKDLYMQSHCKEHELLKEDL